MAPRQFQRPSRLALSTMRRRKIMVSRRRAWRRVRRGRWAEHLTGLAMEPDTHLGMAARILIPTTRILITRITTGRVWESTSARASMVGSGAASGADDLKHHAQKEEGHPRADRSGLFYIVR